MILDTIAAETRRRVAKLKEEGYYETVHEAAKTAKRPEGFPFKRALQKPGLSFICEVKKASPSKGIIAEDFPYEAIAGDYEAGGADAISCLTEPVWFKGDAAYLKAIAGEVKIPVLRKDFIIDVCQIEEALVIGASAILLIAAILSDEELKAFMEKAKSLGLSVLTEAHDEEEIRRALAAGADIIGVNNRNLKDFTIDLSTAARLRPLVPEGIPFVAESGMTTAEAVREMKESGADAVLIGEMLMRAEDRKKAVADLIKACR